MKVIIPTAGFGTRLRPHTYSKPKPLVTVAGKTVLGHVLDSLSQVQLDELIFITGYLGNQIEDYVRNNYAIPARFIEQEELNGQATAVYLARSFVKGPTLILFVDTIADPDLTKLATIDADGVIYVKEVDDPRRFGVVELDNHHITRLVEKPATYVSNLAVIGMYYVKSSEWLMAAIGELIERNIQTKGEYYLADALQLMINQGARLVAERVHVWEDCGKPDALLQTNRHLLDNGGSYGHGGANTVVIPPVYIADTAQVTNSVIGPYVSIGAGAVVQDSIIQDSIINQRAQIRTALIRNSLVGDDATVQANFQQVNVGDSSEIRLG